VKRIGCRIRRLCVDFADNVLVASFNGMVEQIVVESARMATPAGGRGDHNPVDIHKARITAFEPQEARAVVAGALIERQQEGVEVSDPSCQE
jgi:hypothetical protein